MVKQTQGSNANTLGRALEDAVEDVLKRAGFVQLDEDLKRSFHRGLLDFGDSNLPPAWYARNVKKYQNLYQATFFADFIIYHHDAFPHGHLIEVKQQGTPGSVDEKYVFTTLSLIELYKTQNGLSSWFVYDGHGARQSALDWIKSNNQWTARKRVFSFMSMSDVRRYMAGIKK